MTYFTPEALLAFALCAGAALATVIGSAVMIGAHHSNPRLLAFGLAFAGGAMVYISLVEIFGKSFLGFTALYADNPAYTYATLSFFAGIVLVAAIDRLVPNPHATLSMAEGAAPSPHVLKRLGIMAALAITAHNVPEGMATFFAALDDPAVGAPLAIAIAIHNIPEGISIAIPVYYATHSKKAAILATAGSALAEPLGALLGYLILGPFLSPLVYAITFGMIAGVMVYLALDELLPTAKRYASGHETTYGMILGMAAIALSLVLLR